MTTLVMLRLNGDDATYMIDLRAGSVSKVDPSAKFEPRAGEEFRGVALAIATERRDTAATFPTFSD